MFFTIPIGHDRTVFGAPWVTFTIMSVCTVVAALSFVFEATVEGELERSEAEIRAVVARHPRARVSFHVEGLPRAIAREYFEPFVDDDPRRIPQLGDAELDGALRGFVAQLNQLPTLRGGYRPAAPSFDTLLVSMWLHGDVMHLLGNMLFLFVAGTLIESRFRPARFFTFYLASGLIATLVHAFVEYGSLRPMVGASGAIAAMLGAALVLHPGSRIKLGYFVFLLVFFKTGTFRIRAWVWILWWIGWQIVDAVFSDGEPVAYFAHVGGFAFGMATALALHRLDWLEPAYERFETKAEPA